MKHTVALLLAGALASAPVAAVDVQFTADEQAQCDAEGGCHVITMRALHRVMQQAHQAGQAACKSTV